MCGIAGVLRAGASRQSLDADAKAMAATMLHRGPDGEGVWLDAAAGLAFAHRRLSIVDRSIAGAQPMHSSCHRYVICYNGETYNAHELRQQLSALGRTFRGASDTEVVLEASAQWGVQAACVKLIGMFAFAIWDRLERVLWLVRDRLGIKPLFFASFPTQVMFASELKALRACSEWTAEVDNGALAAYMQLGFVPAPQCIYRGVQKVMPGTIVKCQAGAKPTTHTYWSLAEVAHGGARKRFQGDAQEALDTLETLTADAVGRRMLADVPVGAFLSGGIDSSTVVALMQKTAGTPVRTFSIGFSSLAFDEAEHARAVATHLSTDHTSLTVEPRDALSVVSELGDIFDEPFADASQLPTVILARLTKEHVGVALSGDGGDEVFAGYNRHVETANLLGSVLRAPGPVRHALARMCLGARPALWELATSFLPDRVAPRQLGDKAQRLAALLRAGDDAAAAYAALTQQWVDTDAMVIGANAPTRSLPQTTLGSLSERLQFYDGAQYLPDDILCKVDRATMSASLEVRVPLLDHRLVEFAWSLPRDMKIQGRQGKWLLRKLLARHVPEQLTARPKSGFSVPLAEWLRGPLREWADALLSVESLERGGFLHSAPIRTKWREHLELRRNWQYLLWNVLVFQVWQQRWLNVS